MSGFNLTSAQSAAVYERGGAVLVSAAAGSGKTRVIVERLMSYIAQGQDKRSIDDFLIITYTRAAAAELRERIISALAQRIAQNPGDRHLRRQQILCYRAAIGTIHSFCANILRENAHVIGLGRDFRVLEEIRAQEIKERILERLLEGRYEEIETNSSFRQLVDTIGAGRDDYRLVEIVLELHGKIQSHPYPEDWVARQIRELDDGQGDNIFESLWGRELSQNAEDAAAYWALRLDQLLEELGGAGEAGARILKAYGPSLDETAAALRELASRAQAGYFAIRKCLPISFPRLGTLRNSPDEALSGKVKAVRELCRKAMKRLEEDFSASREELAAQFSQTAPAAGQLLTLALDFDRAFRREKLRLGLLDYSDLEHYALELLVSREDGGQTEVARALSGRYTQVMVDEYQDVNRVQDMIFSAISQKGRNLFMVGDVKQSIYRFRLADPGIFIDKYQSYKDVDDALPGEPRRILLQENFRSRPQVIDAVNYLFGQIMSARLGDIDYDETARLYCSGQFEESPGFAARMKILAVPRQEEGKIRPNRLEIEADFVARQIAEMVQGPDLISDGDSLRHLTYGDIVILLRSPGPAAAFFRNALEKHDIPVQAEKSGNFYSTPEISVMLSMLEVIDNPRQDIPLIAVMRSPLFGFGADELARIRACDREGDFYSALRKAAQDNNKCAAFLEKVNEFRRISQGLTLDSLIWSIFSKTNMLALFSAMEGGAARRENLVSFFEYAREFEALDYKGLFGFLGYIKRQRERGEEPPVGAAQAHNAVRIMSIHKSKGMEFPVVFLADTARAFNKRDASRTVLVHPQLGLGLKVVDIQRSLEYPALMRRAIGRRIISEGLSEEMRVLYVAMTRAKERLVISAAWPDPERELEKLRLTLSRPLLPQILFEAKSPAHWIAQAALLEGKKAPIRLEVLDPEPGKRESAPHPWELETAKEAGDPPYTKEEYEEIKARLEYTYPYELSVSLPSKLTATELRDRFSAFARDEEAGDLLPREMELTFREPSFETSGAELGPAERGVALHTVMQYIDLGKTGSLEKIQEEITRLREGGRLSEPESKTVDPLAIKNFFQSETGELLLRADSVSREFRFTVLVPVEEFYDGARGEEILLQGMIDCFVEKDGRLILIDYKTDYVNRDTLQSRAEMYRGQLTAYAKALENVKNMPVSQGFLYFLRAGLSYEIKF